MTKNDIAKDINYSAKLVRVIKVNYLLDYKEGDIITFDDASSWTDMEAVDGNFIVETKRENTYAFYTKGEVDCHKVDYDNEEEVEILGAEGCEDEAECLLEAGSKFKVLDIGTEEDLDEMGFIMIDVELIK